MSKSEQKPWFLHTMPLLLLCCIPISAFLIISALWIRHYIQAAAFCIPIICALSLLFVVWKPRASR